MNKYQAQLDSICRKPFPRQEKPLTGIEKHIAEEKEATEMWQELNKNTGNRQ